jgi:hypothetical protein
MNWGVYRVFIMNLCGLSPAGFVKYRLKSGIARRIDLTSSAITVDYKSLFVPDWQRIYSLKG